MKDPTAAGEANRRFQQIQEAYSGICFFACICFTRFSVRIDILIWHGLAKLKLTCMSPACLFSFIRCCKENSLWCWIAWPPRWWWWRSEFLLILCIHYYVHGFSSFDGYLLNRGYAVQLWKQEFCDFMQEMALMMESVSPQVCALNDLSLLLVMRVSIQIMYELHD